MAATVALRSNLYAVEVLSLTKGSRDPVQTRRLLALSAIVSVGSRSKAAAIGGVGLRTVRDWVLTFNQKGSGGLIDGEAPGAVRVCTLTSEMCLRRWSNSDRRLPPMA
jgi:transposase